MIAIAYDGSDDAKAAVAAAGELFPGQDATIVTVWEHFVDTMARVGGGVGVIVDYNAIDASSQKNAEETAAAGVALATASGLKASARAVAVESTLSDEILAVAADLDATVVVVGSRGFTGVKSVMLGSVSHHLVQHADRPVIVVPSPAVVAARQEHRASLR